MRKLNKRERDVLRLFRELSRQQKSDVLRILIALRNVRE